MPKISVIVPIYKAELYLRRCVDSILSQDFEDIEVILVDDGSPDNCGVICDEYAIKDLRVKVIHKQNAGVSSARNSGMERAGGKYISFVDSDDYILPGMYTHLYQLAEKNELEIALCSIYRCTEDRSYSENDYWVKCENKVDRIAKTPKRDIMYRWCIPGRMSSVCAKLFNADFISKIGISFEDEISEDGIFSTHAVSQAQSIGSVSQAYYVYIDRSGSRMYSYNFDNLERYLDTRWRAYNQELAGDKDIECILGFAAVRMISAMLYNLKLGESRLDKICGFIQDQIDRMSLLPYLQIAAQADIFDEYAKATNLKGDSMDGFYKFTNSLTGGYEGILKWQMRFADEKKG